MAVRLTAPHPKYGKPGEIVKDLDVQTERNLIQAGYAVAAYAHKTAAKTAPRKRPARRKPTKAAALAKNADD